MGGEDTEKDLERIRKEILDKLTPEQREKAEADLAKEKAQAGAGGDKIPEPVSTSDLNLETNSGVKYGNATFNMTAPVGFYDLFRRYRQFIENLQFNTIKIKEGYFNIPENKYTGLENQKNNILKSFNTFNTGLNPNQVQYIDNNATLSEIEKLLDNTLIMDLEDILKQELQKQKVNIIKISGGKKPSSLEKEEKANEEFEELLNPGARKRVINNALAAASGAFSKSTGNTMQDIANAITAAAGATSKIDKTKQKAARTCNRRKHIKKSIAREKKTSY